MDTSTLDTTTSGSDVRVDIAGTTHVGYVRGRNEDSLLVAGDRGLFVVADGLGGHPAGDVASALAVETLDEALDTEVLREDAPGAITTAIQRAHDAINDRSDRDPSTEGMGTTAVVAWTDGDRLVVASVGDSRAYRLRDGTLEQLTTDDVWQAAFGRSLTQALGGRSEITPEVLELEVRPGDRVLLCTDGLTDMVDDDLIADVLGASLPAEDVAQRLTASALDHGGYDNITVIVVLAEPS